MRARSAAAGRPVSDPRCAGCAQLATLRALRRAGLEIRGGLGCDPAAGDPFAAGPGAGRFAAVVGVDEVRRRGERGLADAAERAGARLLVVADRLLPHGGARTAPFAEAPALHADPGDALAIEASVARAADGPALAVVVALAPCARGAARRPRVEVRSARCNRCGACLVLACPALSDPGGEAIGVDGDVCTGCGLCVPLCRSRALALPVICGGPQQ